MTAAPDPDAQLAVLDAMSLAIALAAIAKADGGKA